MGHPGQAPRDLPADRSAGQHPRCNRSAAHAGYVGARLLPGLPQRQGRLRQGLVERCELGERRTAFRSGPLIAAR